MKIHPYDLRYVTIGYSDPAFGNPLRGEISYFVDEKDNHYSLKTFARVKQVTARNKIPALLAEKNIKGIVQKNNGSQHSFIGYYKGNRTATWLNAKGKILGEWGTQIGEEARDISVKRKIRINSLIVCPA